LSDEFILFHKPYITNEEIDGVTETLKSGWLTTGPRAIQFENEFKSHVNSKYALAANSWTAAGHLALESFDIKEGDEVIIPSITFAATAEIICYLRAKPVIVDVQPGTLNIDPRCIEQAITPKTKAVIPVHFGGQPCDMDEITEIAKQNNLLVLEDAAHAFPASYKGKAIGSISDITCFSFYATKPLATGEGGMLCTNNSEYAERASVMRLHGISKDAWKRYSAEGSWYYEVVAPGFKYNFTDIQAALGLAQLKKTSFLMNLRIKIKEQYDNAFKSNEFLSVLELKPDRQSSYHLYPIFIQVDKLTITRNQFIEELKKRNIGVSVHFIPLYKHPFYRNSFNLQEKDYPISEKAFSEIISLPLWPGMTDEQVERVIGSVISIINNHKR